MASKHSSPSMNSPSNSPASLAALLGQIEQALNGIDSGSIEVVVHEGRVVQIERKQRIYGNHDGQGQPA